MDLQSLIRDIGYEPIKYSGSGMQNCYCLAVRVGNLGNLISKLIERIQVSPNEIDQSISESFRYLRTVSSGLDTVVYFPTLKFKE